MEGIDKNILRLKIEKREVYIGSKNKVFSKNSVFNIKIAF